jgi:hypothetical protein
MFEVLHHTLVTYGVLLAVFSLVAIAAPARRRP